MRIFIVDDFSHFGGAEIVLLRVLEYLLKQGSVLCAAVPGPGSVSHTLDRMGIPCVFVDILKLKQDWLNPLAWHGMHSRFRKHIRSFNPDVILTNSIWALCALRSNMLLSGIPVICAHHASMTPKSDMKRRFFNRFGKFLVNGANHWITVSRSLKSELASLKIPDKHITVIPNGVDLAKFHPERRDPGIFRRFGFTEDNRVIGSVGRLHPGKGQDTVIRAARQVLNRCSSARFILPGKEIITPSEHLQFTFYLERLISDFNLKEKVVLPGFLMDIAGVISSLDIYVSASKEESFGLAVLEAMAGGVPVVAYGVGGLIDLVDDNINGFLVADDPGAFARKICLLLENPDLRSELGSAARKKAEAYAVERMVKAWEKCITTVTEGK